jgi:hypothetical protein
MKTIFALAALFVIILPGFGQISTMPKPYVEPDLTLIDVVRNVTPQLQPGARTIKTCCGGLKLVAKVEKGKGENAGKNIVATWHVYDQDGKELKGEIGEPRSDDGTTIETVIVIKDLGYGFIVARRKAQ